MEWFQMLSDNWGVITGAALVIIAGVDKVALVFIKTLRNILDSWQESFPIKRDDKKDNSQ